MKTKCTVYLKLMTFACLTALLGSLSVAQAFCVKNETDVRIDAQQTTNYKMFRGFSESVAPDSKRCCSWENDTCNKAGKKDSPTTFDITYQFSPPGAPTTGGVSQTKTVCGTYSIPANGTLVVSGKNGSYRCETH